MGVNVHGLDALTVDDDLAPAGLGLRRLGDAQLAIGEDETGYRCCRRLQKISAGGHERGSSVAGTVGLALADLTSLGGQPASAPAHTMPWRAATIATLMRSLKGSGTHLQQRAARTPGAARQTCARGDDVPRAILRWLGLTRATDGLVLPRPAAGEREPPCGRHDLGACEANILSWRSLIAESWSIAARSMRQVM